MATSSSTLSSENEVKDHPQQVLIEQLPGPRGAFEARQVKDEGFYARIDMPGVPPNGVKLAKYAETRTVTFSGKAPEHWINDGSNRVYGGYVVLDRDPNEIQVEMTVKNGCLMLFFPGSEGTLHFLGRSKPPKVEDVEEVQHVIREDSDGPVEIKMLVSANKSYSHINPYLMQGVEGVYETREVDGGETSEMWYLRLDMPGLASKLCTVAVAENFEHIIYGGEGEKEHRFDEGGREYFCSFYLECGCCKIVGLETYVMRDGVLRMLIRKNKIQDIQSPQSIPNPGSSNRRRTKKVIK